METREIKNDQSRVISKKGMQKSSKVSFFCVLVATSGMSLIPFAFPKCIPFLDQATFEIGIPASMICFGVVSLITAVFTYIDKENQRNWQDKNGISWVVLLPPVAPYLVVALIWVVLFIVVFQLIIAMDNLIESISNG